jgi:hypothetical protein
MERDDMRLAHGIKCEVMNYPKSLLKAWERGDYSFLLKSRASAYIKNILVCKAKKRPGRRFFGEAYIASKIEMRDGYYCSFKWLTASKWITGDCLDSVREGSFHQGLMKYLGPETVLNLQKKAMTYSKGTGRESTKPVEPDLLLIAKNGEIRFIESKMPWDTIRPSQLAGLKLIKKYLTVDVPVRTSIINLHAE